MFDLLKRVSLAKLFVRYVKAHERLADAACDIRDHLCGTSRVAVNRPDAPVDDDPTAIFISYANDNDTYEREIAEQANQGRFGRGNKGPF